ncbi:MAG TPA: Rieske 2Fe-2S domain-containing protein [Bradyrhizobium sp.]|nr:Rieske 2Fe-2S domain-containing protein [Bradyrhizobium sp.]
MNDMPYRRPGAEAPSPSERPPECPENWYLVAASKDIAPGGIVTCCFGAQEIVVARGGENNAVYAFEAHCQHQGCHLKHATTVKGGLRCALHHRVIRYDGAFLLPDGAVNPTLRQGTLPAREAFGGVFVFAGSSATFDIPSPEIAQAGLITTRYLKPRTFDLPWSTLVSNGIDIDHLQTVHDRRLREAPSLELLEPNRIRLRYRTAVTGSRLSDRIMKWLSNDEIIGSITCIGGSTMLVETRIGNRETFILLSMSPTPGGGSTVRGLVGSTGNPAAVTSRLRVRLAAWLFESFLEKDVGILEDIAWHPPHSGTSPGDSMMRQLYAFFCTQPEFSAGQRPGAAAIRYLDPFDRPTTLTDTER